MPMKLVNFIDERGIIYTVNLNAIAEVEAAGENLTRIYMDTHACRAHAIVMRTTPKEVSAIAGDERHGEIIHSAAVQAYFDSLEEAE